MSSISVGELKDLLQNCPDDMEVVMYIKHKYTIDEDVGRKGWIAYINGVHCDDTYNEVRLMN